MDHLKIMKAVEVLSIFACIFFVTLSLGNGAPQWRPQGRFGKRFGASRNSDIMTALQSVSDDNEHLDPLFMEEPNGDVTSDVIDDFYNSLPSEASSSGPRKPMTGARICIETSLPGIFRCHRRKRSSGSVMSMHEE